MAANLNPTAWPTSPQGGDWLDANSGYLMNSAGAPIRQVANPTGHMQIPPELTNDPLAQQAIAAQNAYTTHNNLPSAYGQQQMGQTPSDPFAGRPIAPVGPTGWSNGNTSGAAPSSGAAQQAPGPANLGGGGQPGGLLGGAMGAAGMGPTGSGNNMGAMQATGYAPRGLTGDSGGGIDMQGYTMPGRVSPVAPGAYQSPSAPQQSAMPQWSDQQRQAPGAPGALASSAAPQQSAMPQWSDQSHPAPTAPGALAPNTGGQIGSLQAPSAPTYAPAATLSGYDNANPYLKQQADAISQQMNSNMTRNVLPQLGTAAMAAGGYGDSRHGVLEANLYKDMNQGLSNSIANLYGTDYTNSQNRNMQKYAADQQAAASANSLSLGKYQADQSYALGARGQDLSKYGMDQNFGLGARGQDVSMYGINQGNNTALRGQDLSRYGIDQSTALGMNGQNIQRYGIDQNTNLGARGQDVSMYGINQGNNTALRGQDLSRYGIDQNTALGMNGQSIQRYGIDQSTGLGARGQDVSLYGMNQNNNTAMRGQDMNFGLGARGQDVAMRGQDQNYATAYRGQDLSRYQGDQSFYTSQRGQDMTGAALGANLYNMGMQGPWDSLQNASKVYSPYSGIGSNTQNQSQGGGWQGAAGGALGAAQLAKNIWS